MIEPISSLSVDVVPQAIIALSVQEIVGAQVSSGQDDFDSFEGASFMLDREIQIAVRHYRGHPRNTSTIYIDRRESDVQAITRIIRKILHDLHVPIGALKWERQNDPDL